MDPDTSSDKFFECVVVKEEYSSLEDDVINEKIEDIDAESKTDIKVEPMEVEAQTKPFKCETCFKVFTCEKTFLIHKQTHFNQNKTCHVCKRTFPLVKSLKRHLVQMHVSKEKYPCPICGKQLTLKKSLASHMESFHKETEELDRLTEEPFSCKHCKKLFWEQDLYQQHLKNHEKLSNIQKKEEKVKTEQENYECADCGKIFRYKNHLKGHVVTHGLPSFHCPYCRKMYCLQRLLRRHINLMHKGLPIGLTDKGEPIMSKMKPFKNNVYPRLGIFEAMKLVSEGTNILKAAKTCKVPEATLRRYVKLYNNSAPIPVSGGRFRNTFTSALEEKLYEFVREINRKTFGIKRGDFGRLAFEFAEREELEHRFNGSRKTAGCRFITRFMEKFNIVFISNDSSYVLKEVGFKKNTVDGFFQLYRELRSEHAFRPSRMFNMEEVGCPVMKKKDPANVMLRGSRKATFQAGIEPDTQVSVACCFSATGQYLPLFFFHPETECPDLNEFPSDSHFSPSPLPWIHPEGFIKWLQVFISVVKPTHEDPVLLLMDGYAFFTSIESEIMARDNFVTILGFPVYTSHKMQPFEVTIFPALKAKYRDICLDFLYDHTGNSLTLQEIVRMFNAAYGQVTTEKVAIKGFKMTGIEPINSEKLFSK